MLLFGQPANGCRIEFPALKRVAIGARNDGTLPLEAANGSMPPVMRAIRSDCFGRAMKFTNCLAAARLCVDLLITSVIAVPIGTWVSLALSAGKANIP